MFLAFPKLFAAAFSGFYLHLMVLLWLMILRGIAIEFRNHVAGPIWSPLWDVVFAFSSGLLALFLGIALGNVIRGVPFDTDGDFFLPLWATDRPGVIDPYTLLIGITACSALWMHGCWWLALRCTGDIQSRARRRGTLALKLTAALVAASTAASFRVRPELMSTLPSPAGLLMASVASASAAGCWQFSRKLESARAFLCSSAFLTAMLANAAYGLYPWVLPPIAESGTGLTAQSAAAPTASLQVALYWWVPGMILAILYAVFVYWHVCKDGPILAHSQNQTEESPVRGKETEEL